MLGEVWQSSVEFGGIICDVLDEVGGSDRQRGWKRSDEVGSSALVKRVEAFRRGS